MGLIPGQLPAFVEQAGGGHTGPFGAGLQFEDAKITEAGQAVLVSELAILDGHRAMEDDVAAGGERVGVDERGRVPGGGEGLGAGAGAVTGPVEGRALEAGAEAERVGVGFGVPELAGGAARRKGPVGE